MRMSGREVTGPVSGDDVVGERVVTPAEMAGAGGPVRSEDGGRGARMAWMDVLRGVALCGIIFVNARVLMWRGAEEIGNLPVPLRDFLALWVQERFFPLFCWLFGLGFGLMWLSARARTARPRRALVQRIGVLGVLGCAHQFLQPGEALLFYAVTALVVLLPSTWCPRWLVLVAAAVLAPAGVFFGGAAAIPGLFLLGFAMSLYGVPQVLERRPWIGGLVFFVTFPFAVTMARWQLLDPVNAGFSTASHVAGGLMAVCYASAVIAAMGLPVVRRVLSVVFAPLGRMALTNYLTASVSIFAFAALLEPLGLAGRGSDVWYAAMWACAATLVVQWAWSTAWLSWRSQGPLEELWRRLTWAGVARR
ncbi:Uncharacterized membrane protein YeiB [Austwickia chelonae]|uniref:DUF418 domain-containing protein n=2 Tax=Austwickia TaxID=1184606 RepID=K6VAF0_9MICO|nr:hypothetical protein AUCHE_21_00390 [Austwickia chelonae NBRC 105200]SEW37279.1 Uncharacterized membrane protein YeiB [Austwickia chelonae]